MTHISFSINECAAIYNLTTKEQKLLKQAADLLSSKMCNTMEPMHSPAKVMSAVRTYVTLTHAHKEREVFSVMYLNNQNHLIKIVDEFSGTIDGATVYPREIVKHALSLNAAAVILVHNHPSGSNTPSNADERITQKIMSALDLVDIRVLDHIIVAGMETVSMAELGMV